MPAPQHTDGYIRDFPAATQAMLEQMRATIRAAAPNAEETISYNMPSYVLDGERLVWFAGFKSHIGFYPGAAAIAEFKKELSPYKTAKGSVQFPVSDALPLRLIARMVKFRVKQARRTG